MKARRFASLLLLACCAGCMVSVTRGPDESADPSEPYGRVSTVGELSDGLQHNSRVVSTEVTYLNTTSRTFSVVTIWCRVLDRDDFQLSAQAWTLSSGNTGPIEPGFKTRGTLRIITPKEVEVERMECAITDATELHK